jgi:hypothetical protein
MNNLLQKVIFFFQLRNDFIQPENSEENWRNTTPRRHFNVEPLNEATHKEVELHKNAEVFKPLMCSKQQT